jgi:hypothetical protein
MKTACSSARKQKTTTASPSDVLSVCRSGAVTTVPEQDIRTGDWKYRIEGYVPQLLNEVPGINDLSLRQAGVKVGFCLISRTSGHLLVGKYQHFRLIAIA